jgi:creatinine amidohydrolase
MSFRLAELTWPEAGRAARENRRVIVPAGATEAHGQHLPLDVDTHQATAVAERLAERVGGLVAPALPYGYSTTWMGFPGTVTLSSETFQQVLVEVCSSLVEHGFYRVLILNGHRPNGTACDCAARRVVDAYAHETPIEVTAVSYWEPAAAELHAMRRSAVGGMGHACEMETSVQMATRPQLVKMERLEGVKPPLVKWDLVAPIEPSRTYLSWPTAAEGHPGIFGDPFSASPEAGGRFLDTIVDGLVRMLDSVERTGGAYSTQSTSG